MRSFDNPFRVRASEQERDQLSFLRHFGLGVLELLPPSIWDRLLVLRSAPGGGKTSLMRLFSARSLQTVHNRRDDLEELDAQLRRVGALESQGPLRLGVLLGLDRDYRALMDIGFPQDIALRLFFHLLDARIMVAVLHASLDMVGGRFPSDCGALRLKPLNQLQGTDEAASRVGGVEGSGILEEGRRVEGGILDALDTLRPARALLEGLGHNDIYSLRLLSDVDIEFEGRVLSAAPLVMFDDGHDLAQVQREELLRRLRSRDMRVSRWYSERFEVLSPPELLSPGDIRGRDYELLELEAAARGDSRRFAGLLWQVADRRASRPLKQYGGTDGFFSDLCNFGPDEFLIDRRDEVFAGVQHLTRELAANDPRYELLLRQKPAPSSFEDAVWWRELAIVIERDKRRATRELFTVPLSEEEVDRQVGGGLRQAARLMLCAEYRLPYYAGTFALAALGSHNIEQFLGICGDLFDEVLAAITLGHQLRIPAARQDTLIRQLSHEYWRNIPRRLPHGEDVLRLVNAIGVMAREQTYRKTAPYTPGVSGTAITMRDKGHLVEIAHPERSPGAYRLLHALSSGIAYNVFSAEPDRSVKGDIFMVLYLNRLLCPRFGLPLGRGGFRERRLDEVIGWITNPQSDLNLSEDAAQLSL